jgi:indolepyruvate ferredoxin oxidoreductase
VCPGSTDLTEAVARYLYKLMAYKDEYEVARLYTDGAFLQKLGETFEGDFRLTFHLAPPIFNRGLDALGRPRKTSFGPWMMAAFRLLARFRVLRGTALDPFGWFAERKEERGLIDDYRLMVEELIVGLKPENHHLAVACASLPDQVRGYGPVKAESMSRYRELRAAQLHRFRNPARVVQIQEVA